jgi:hypothetical protein
MTAASALAVPQFRGSNNITVTVRNLVAVVTHKLSSIAPCTAVSSDGGSPPLETALAGAAFGHLTMACCLCGVECVGPGASQERWRPSIRAADHRAGRVGCDLDAGADTEPFQGVFPAITPRKDDHRCGHHHRYGKREREGVGALQDGAREHRVIVDLHVTRAFTRESRAVVSYSGERGSVGRRDRPGAWHSLRSTRPAKMLTPRREFQPRGQSAGPLGSRRGR